MAINKLPEFAKDGQKNTDDLVLTDGFPVSKKPARQWFNYLFNMLSLKINEIIESDPVTRSEIIDNLTTNDATKPLSAKQGKDLQDSKLGKTENAASAAKLATARTIGGVSFDGTANINLPGVNTAGNQNTSGNAATATELATARTINGVSFDGTANITIADSTKLPTTGGTVTGALAVNGLLTANGGFKGHYVVTDNRALVPSATPKGAIGAYFTSQGGLTGAVDHTYGDLLTLNSYYDASGGNVNALFFAKGGKSIFHYQAAQGATTWGTANRLAYVTDNVASATNCGRSVVAGNGLTGGGALTSDSTVTLGTPSKITGSTTNSVTATSHTHEIDKASTSVAGVVQLNNTLTSASTAEALTAAQGKVLNDQAFGVGQTWKNLTASRVLGTTYTNTTGKPIVVCVRGYLPAGGGQTGKINGETVQSFSGYSSGLTSTVTLIVPPGGTYSVSGSKEAWWELN